MSEKWSKYYQSPTDKQSPKLFKIGLKCQIKIPKMQKLVKKKDQNWSKYYKQALLMLG